MVPSNFVILLFNFLFVSQDILECKEKVKQCMICIAIIIWPNGQTILFLFEWLNLCMSVACMDACHKETNTHPSIQDQTKELKNRAINI